MFVNLRSMMGVKCSRNSEFKFLVTKLMALDIVRWDKSFLVLLDF